MKNYFESIKSLEDLKKAYRAAALANHPDKGGDTAEMQRINNDYEEREKQLVKAHNATAGAKPVTECASEFIAVIQAIIALEGLIVEICGSWIWVTGATKTHKEALKAAGYRWSNKKCAWYWHKEDDGSCFYRGKKSLDEIRAKWGSDIVAAPPSRKSLA